MRRKIPDHCIINQERKNIFLGIFFRCMRPMPKVKVQGSFFLACYLKSLYYYFDYPGDLILSEGLQ
ncbi:MAG: hypothetical protein COX19_04125 [Desulfobacterales bacterium CG23_combo_of_CG06-09_8_20_14_all_51_8]|nr:MAG: hypothetical protein COX19_04125 [Desulfobacterales bacterium CG23_combo_of_CG06-09_8_20_14_all_51_8]